MIKFKVSCHDSNVIVIHCGEFRNEEDCVYTAFEYPTSPSDLVNTLRASLNTLISELNK